MPSSLATVLSLTSGSSPCPPVSVLVRAAMESTLETFPGSWPHVLRYLSVDVPLPVTFYIPTTHFTAVLLFASPTIHSVGHTSLLRHSFTSIAGTGISACFPSTTPFGLALGPDLPRADEPSLEPLGYRCVGFSPTSRYSHRHSHFHTLHQSLRSDFYAVWNAPLPLVLLQIRSFGSMLSPGTFSAQGHSTSELLRTL